tara:strand:+ start:662 stop:2452 length:1791 start_codon:yes stop_codon:yes gene_type:complete
MTQKLIRLTCESNDGVFDGLFDQDIRIKQDSEIAFQSLTLERASTSFNVNNSNKQMVFFAKDSFSGYQQANIPVGLYQKEDRFELMQGIQDALNKSCNMLTKNAIMNLQWVAEIDEDEDTVVIGVRPSPFFPLACYDTTAAAPLYNSAVILDAPVENSVAGAETPSIGPNGMGRLAQTNNANGLNECYMFNQENFIQSTGSWRCRLHDVSVGTANRPVLTLGLVNAAGLVKLKAGTIEMTDLVYAIQVNQKSADAAQGGYSYINTLGSAATIPLLKPNGDLVKIEKSDFGTLDNNDVLEIVIRNGALQGLIHQDADGLTTLPASAPVGVGKGEALWPVVFFHLANTDGTPPTGVPANQKATFDLLDCSLDPWVNGVSQLADDTWNSYVTDNPQLEPKQSALPSVIQYDTVQAIEPFETQFGFASFDIAEYLGYTSADLVTNIPPVGIGARLRFPPAITLVDPISTDAYRRAQGYDLYGRNTFGAAVDSDSYLVDTQTFMLDSFDSYGLSANERNANAGGSRRNLLATIPVTETVIPNSVNARISYEPNTLDYIAIKNRSDVITRQIRMRLLDARYEPITTAGLAAITILIREPYSD